MLGFVGLNAVEIQLLLELGNGALTLGKILPCGGKRVARVHQLDLHLPNLHGAAIQLLLLRAQAVALDLKFSEIKIHAVTARAEQQNTKDRQQRHGGGQAAQAAAENRAGLFLRRLLRCGRSAGLLRTLRRQDDMLIHIGRFLQGFIDNARTGFAEHLPFRNAASAADTVHDRRSFVFLSFSYFTTNFARCKGGFLSL